MFSWLSFSRKYLSRFQQKLIISCRSSLDWVTTLRGDGDVLFFLPEFKTELQFITGIYSSDVSPRFTETGAYM